MKSSPSCLLVAFATLAVATFAGCQDTTYEIQPAAPSISGDSSANAQDPIVTAPSAVDDETDTKIKELEAKIDELNQKLDENQPSVPETKPTVEETPNDSQAEAPKNDPKPEEPKTLTPVKDSHAEANPPTKQYSVADAVAFSPFTPHTPGSVCGDGIWGPNKECDDGNARSGDGCFNCRTEAGWECDGGSDLTPCWPIGQKPSE